MGLSNTGADLYGHGELRNGINMLLRVFEKCINSDGSNRITLNLAIQ